MNLEPVDKGVFFEVKIAASGPEIAFREGCEEKNPGHVLPFIGETSPGR